MTRLRYIKIKDTSLVISKNPILCNNKNVNVTINESTLVYKIYEMIGVLVEGQGKTMAEVKKLVKRDLLTLGASFKNEIRNRGNTEKL